jgi:lysophospholipase L1-like esterase
LLGALVVCLGQLAMLPDRAAAEPRISWRVENPFRLFTRPSDSEVHRATYNDLGESERTTPVLSAERALARRHPGDGWAAGMMDNLCWSAERNRYGCRESPDYLHPRAHRIQFALRDVPDADRINCTWLTTPLARSGLGGSVTARCDQTVTLPIPYPVGARVSVEVGGREIATDIAKVTDLFVVAMGDSFASGEGNPDVPVRFSRERRADYGFGPGNEPLSGYPARVGPWQAIGDTAFIKSNARWIDQACHRSLYSHQLRAALQLAVEDPHRAVTFVGYACSGAEIVDGLFRRYKGHEWVPNPPDISQLSAIAQAQCGPKRAEEQEMPEAYHMRGRIAELRGGLILRRCDADDARKIDLVLVSVGGNDIGFARLLANAILADESSLRRLSGWFGQVHGFLAASELLDGLEARLLSLKRAIHGQLHVPWAEQDRIMLVAYPSLALLPDGRQICPDGRAGMTVTPDFLLSENRARESMAAGERLDAVMEDTSKQNGWTYVASHRQQFRGRGICAGYTDNAFTIADDLRMPRWTGRRWEPFNPADWQAYAPRQRWFRTPNDAFMTGNFHVSESLMQKVLKLQGFSSFQLLLASIYSGAFHPTAEGQAAMADAVVVEARRVLAKYAAQ